MREDQQEQQMIEILEKVSDQVKRVENMHSGWVPALEGEYYTPSCKSNESEHFK